MIILNVKVALFPLNPFNNSGHTLCPNPSPVKGRLIRDRISSYTFVKNEFVPVKKSCPRTLDNYNYVEIGDIDVGTGSAFANTVATEELPDNAKIMTQKGDLLVSTVRPNRGAVAILGNGDLLVSGAFTVLREDGDYPKEVLQVLLRTSMYRDYISEQWIQVKLSPK